VRLLVLVVEDEEVELDVGELKVEVRVVVGREAKRVWEEVGRGLMRRGNEV